ncbi:MAG: hypothetical protein ACK4YP_19240 [Myxococcota bacterium]
MLVLLLAACIETNIHPGKPPPDDTGAVDTADTGAVDSGADTGAIDSAADTAVDTGADTAPVETGDVPVDTAIDTDTDTGEPDTDAPGPLVVDGFCSDGGYVYTSWADESPAEPEMHLVGVYESREGDRGAVNVTVERNTRMVLALTSYSAVDWRVDLSPGTTVEEIVVSSYDASTVTFVSPTTAPVTYVGWLGCGYAWPDAESSGCETPDLQAAVESYTRLAMSSFQGCYAGGDFTIE